MAMPSTATWAFINCPSSSFRSSSSTHIVQRSSPPTALSVIMTNTRSSSANETAQQSGMRTRSTSGANKKAPHSKAPANASRTLQTGRGRSPQESADGATSSADEAVIVDAPQDAGVPVEGALVNSNVVALDAEPRQLSGRGRSSHLPAPHHQSRTWQREG